MTWLAFWGGVAREVAKQAIKQELKGELRERAEDAVTEGFVPVSSSHLRAVAYDDENQKLRVQFHNGATYTYYGVPKRVYAALMSAGSVGHYFNTHIRKRYGSTKG